MTLGELIKSYCEEHRLSYEKFGERCNSSKAYISMLVRGRNPKTGKPIELSLKKYTQIAEAMGMTLTDLCRIIEDAPITIDKDPDEEEMWTLRESLRRDPNRRILFDLAKNADAKDVQAAVALIEALRASNPDFYDGEDPA